MAEDENKVLMTEEEGNAEEEPQQVKHECHSEETKTEDSIRVEGATNTEEEKIKDLREELDNVLGGISQNSPTEADEQKQGDGPSQPTQKAYVAPLEDPYSRAMKYLAKHDILQLFQGITAGIVYRRPADPLDFMVGEIETLQEQERLRTHEMKKTDSASLKEQTVDTEKQS